MNALCWHGKQHVQIEEVPEPDAIICVTAICGSGLHLYGDLMPTMKTGDILGHEFMGEVVDVGSGNEKLKIGDKVVVPFTISCGKCSFCKKGLLALCDNSNPNASLVKNQWDNPLKRPMFLTKKYII